MAVDMAHERREEKRRELLNKLLINRETSVLNTVINTERIIKTISFRREHFQLLRNFTDKAKLERSNFQAKDGFSELAIKAFTEYMQHHPLPNPQLTLERSLNLGMPAKKSSQCCVSNCQGKARFRLILKDFEGKREVFHVCETHKKWKHKRFRFIESIKKLEP